MRQRSLGQHMHDAAFPWARMQGSRTQLPHTQPRGTPTPPLSLGPQPQDNSDGRRRRKDGRTRTHVEVYSTHSQVRTRTYLFLLGLFNIVRLLTHIPSKYESRSVEGKQFVSMHT